MHSSGYQSSIVEVPMFVRLRSWHSIYLRYCTVLVSLICCCHVIWERPTGESWQITYWTRDRRRPVRIRDGTHGVSWTSFAAQTKSEHFRVIMLASHIIFFPDLFRLVVTSRDSEMFDRTNQLAVVREGQTTSIPSR